LPYPFEPATKTAQLSAEAKANKASTTKIVRAFIRERFEIFIKIIS